MKYANKQTCVWHWLLKQDIQVQLDAASRRLASCTEEHVPRKTLDIEGERWCAGCQSAIPLFYASGSRCRADSSRARHATSVKGTYGITEAEYAALLAWQGGACYVCRRKPHTRRLAVDHNHLTGEVRGLLCADPTFGCNKAIIGNIEAARTHEEALAMASRIVGYLADAPMARMRRGERPALARPLTDLEYRLGPYAAGLTEADVHATIDPDEAAWARLIGGQT